MIKDDRAFSKATREIIIKPGGSGKDNVPFNQSNKEIIMIAIIVLVVLAMVVILPVLPTILEEMIRALDEEARRPPKFPPPRKLLPPTTVAATAVSGSAIATKEEVQRTLSRYPAVSSAVYHPNREERP